MNYSELAEKYKEVMADKAVTNMNIWHTKVYKDKEKEPVDELAYRAALLGSATLNLDRMNNILRDMSI